MGNRRSVATIDAPEFINITQMSNPLISKCEIKVLYIGANRNQSFITKEVATQMAQTLPGCPIVGYYIENKEDFGDHGDQIIIDAEGVKFKKLTKPYGFVAPDSKVWFQKFDDTDEFGNTITREYLMTEGYLWTGQYEEAKKVVEEGRSQSMELDEKTLKGHWAEDTNRGVQFFIINDAVFSKLCILGEDTEPCFEGAAVTAPSVSKNFTKDDNLIKSLFSMMSELQYALQKEGGSSVENENVITSTEGTEFSENLGINGESISLENDVTTGEFTKNDSSEKKENEKDLEDKNNNSESDSTSENKENKEEDDEKNKKKVTENSYHSEEEYELLQTKFDNLQAEFTALQETVSALQNFKLEVENKRKDELIASFYMLSDEDKQDVLENKANYSLEDIKAKLSVICFDKKVNFNLDREEEHEVEDASKPATTFNLNSHEADTLPAWLRAVQNIKDSKQ